MLRTLISRHLEDTNTRRTVLLERLPADAALPELLTAMILPWVDHLDSLPVPSWRARFLHQIRSVPSVHNVLSTSDGASPAMEELIRRTQSAASGVPPSVLYGRSSILGSMVLGVCAEYEARLQDGVETPNWTGVGYFLIDACAGMLAAPVTRPGDFLARPSSVYLL